MLPVIDAEFQSLIPKLSISELQQLEQNIIAEGCRDALVVWRGILIDGHNRFAICQRHNLPFNTVEMSLADRDAVMNWIDGNQLGRRNLTPDQMSLIRGRRYNRMKKAWGGHLPYEKEVGKVPTSSPFGAAKPEADEQDLICFEETSEEVIEIEEEEEIEEEDEQIEENEELLQGNEDVPETIPPIVKPKTAAILAAEYGVDERTIRRDAERATFVEQQSPIIQQGIRDGHIKIAAVKRELRREEISRIVASPESKYRVLYADPPWAYRDVVDEGGVQSSGAAHKYPTMSIAELCALPVSDWCEPDAVLFLWVTSPFLSECWPVITAWGFAYKASFVWDKIKHNMGHYNSVRHEFLLVCTRGSCTPDVKQLFDSVQSIERTEHSVKPEDFRKIIDTIYPHGKRLEMFARRGASGWETWGNESPESK